MSVPRRRTQAAYEYVDRGDAAPASVEEQVVTALKAYLGGSLGLSDEFIRDRTDVELARRIPAGVLDALEHTGIRVAGATVLDLGAGLGGLSAELAARGARVISIEPGAAWRDIAAARLKVFPAASIIGAVGERIPLRDASVDLVVSLQVLEHVQDPAAVIAEVYRVLKPGGTFMLACENYLAFREQHYKVAWLPLLPKPIGSLYLRLRGRPDRFLKEAVTYTTLPGVLAAARGVGFESAREARIRASVTRAAGVRTRWKRLLLLAASRFLGEAALAGLIIRVDILSRLFRVGIREILVKH